MKVEFINYIWWHYYKLVHGGWGEWSEWDECPVSCGGADQARTRVCDNPAPEFGGDDCTIDGSTPTETQRCNENPCPSKSNFEVALRRKKNIIILTKFAINQNFTFLISSRWRIQRVGWMVSMYCWMWRWRSNKVKTMWQPCSRVRWFGVWRRLYRVPTMQHGSMSIILSSLITSRKRKIN